MNEKVDDSERDLVIDRLLQIPENKVSQLNFF